MGDLGNLIRMDMQACADDARKDEREKIYNRLKNIVAYTEMGDIIPWCDIECLFEEFRRSDKQQGVNK